MGGNRRHLSDRVGWTILIGRRTLREVRVRNQMFDASEIGIRQLSEVSS